MAGQVLLALTNPLRQLIATAGVKLVPAPCGTWNFDGYAAKLRRPLSVTFSVDAVVSGEEVLDAVCNAGVAPEEIVSIQFRGSNRSWCVSFASRATKDRLLERGVLQIGNSTVFVGDADFKTVIVKVYEAPPEMPDTVVIGRLSHYGRVLSFRRDFGAATRVHNGVRTAQMRLSSAIPSSVRIAGEVIFFPYSGQPRTCRRCGEEGHLAQGCRKPRCFNCEAPGHVSSECDRDPLCGVCLKEDHHESDCPYVILSANVESAVVSTPSYADVARQKRPASPAAPPPADHQQRKRKADREQSRSVTPVRDRNVNPEDRGKVRRREEEPETDREDRRRRDRDRRQEDQGESQYHREDRREDRRRERDRGREDERERRHEGHRPRERSERDRGGNHDRRRSPDRRPSRGRSSQLFSSDSESDEEHRDRRRRHRKNH